MKVISIKQKDRPVYIKENNDNDIVDIENTHMELTLDDGSIFILPSIDCYYEFIGSDVCFGNKEIFLEKLVSPEDKITLVETEFDGIFVKSVWVGKYNDEEIYLLKI